MIPDHPIPGTKWLYTGPGEGSGLEHQVIDVLDDGRIVTWAEGFTWMGDLDTFMHHFEPPQLTP